MIQDFTIDNFAKGANNLYFDKNNMLTSYKPIKSLFSQLNYDSYLVYLYIVLYFLINLPYTIFSFLLNIFNYQFIFDTFFKAYESLTTWYIPLLINDNIFYLLSKTLNNNYFFNSYFDLLTNLNSLFSSFFSFYNLYIYNFNFSNFLNIFNSFGLFFINILDPFINALSALIGTTSLIIFSNKTSLFFITLHNAYTGNISFINSFTYPTAKNKDTSLYSSNFFNNTDLSFNLKYSNEEITESSRYLKFYNPVFKYDYKSGDYFPKSYKEIFYGYLFTTIGDLTSSVRTAPWFISDKYIEAFNINFNNYFDNITQTSTLPNMVLHNWSTSRFNHTDAFYNFFFYFIKWYKLHQ